MFNGIPDELPDWPVVLHSGLAFNLLSYPLLIDVRGENLASRFNSQLEQLNRRLLRVYATNESKMIIEDFSFFDVGCPASLLSLRLILSFAIPLFRAIWF
jgi:hypothetical protein